MSACDRGYNAAWKSHTFIVLQEGGGIRMRSTVEVGVVCGSHSDGNFHVSWPATAQTFETCIHNTEIFSTLCHCDIVISTSHLFV